MLQAKNKILVFSIFISSLFIFQGCPSQPPTTTVNTNTTTNTNLSNTTTANSTTNTTTINASVVDTKEPEQYQALVKLKFETTGTQKLTMPGELQANVARSGQNRRMEFNMPNGDKLVYLDAGGKHFLVLPNRKQYAELDRQSVGFELRSMMTPEQIIKQIQSMKGVQKVGEEKFNNRDAVKYEYSAVTDTKSQAGNVETKSFIFVDKETSLPLRSETTAASMGGNYQGVQGIKVITDISNIQTNVDANLFAEPTDFAKVQPEQVKQQVDTVFNAVTVILQQLLKNASTQQQPAANTNTAPTANP